MSSPEGPRYTPTSPAEIREKVAAVRASKAAARRRGWAWGMLLLAGLALAGARLTHRPHFRHARRHAHLRALRRAGTERACRTSG